MLTSKDVIQNFRDFEIKELKKKMSFKDNSQKFNAGVEIVKFIHEDEKDKKRGLNVNVVDFRKVFRQRL